VSDATIAAIVAAASAVGAALLAFLRWVVNRITSSWDRGTQALIDNTAQARELSVRLETFTSELRIVGSRIDALAEWAEEHSDVGPAPRLRARTPREGVRASTAGEYGPLKPRSGG
jgi:hypothetical protein